MSHGYACIHLTPMARARLGDADGLALDALAAKLGADVTAGYSTMQGGWTVHAWAGTLHSDSYGGKGAVAVAIRAALGDIEQQQTLADDVWTPEEILQVAAQTPGMDVRRA
jgi:hypothetical protein